MGCLTKGLLQNLWDRVTLPFKSMKIDDVKAIVLTPEVAL
jgi:hypothetical protein